MKKMLVIYSEPKVLTYFVFNQNVVRDEGCLSKQPYDFNTSLLSRPLFTEGLIAETWERADLIENEKF